MSGPILECFGSISYHFRDHGAPLTSCDVAGRSGCAAGIRDVSALIGRQRVFGGVSVNEAGLDELYSEHLRTLSERTDAALAATGIRRAGDSRGRPAHPVSGRSGLSVQGESAFQGLGADRRQSRLHADLRARARPAGAVSSCRATTGTSRRACRASPGPSTVEIIAACPIPPRAPRTGPGSAGSPSSARARRFPTQPAGTPQRSRICSRGCTTTGP